MLQAEFYEHEMMRFHTTSMVSIVDEEAPRWENGIRNFIRKEQHLVLKWASLKHEDILIHFENICD